MRYIILCCLLFSSLSSAHGLVKGTPVKTPSGYVPVEELAVGDLVWACNFEREECQPERVIQVSIVKADGYVELCIEGETLQMSETHRLWSPSRGRWIDAGEIASRYVAERVKLYNIGVESHHNYYIGKSDVLAHNFVFMIPILAWGGGAAVTWISASIAAAAVGTGIGVGIAMDQAAKRSNTPSAGYYDTTPLTSVIEARGHKTEPRDERVFHVDQYGNNIPVEKGEVLHSSPNGNYQHVKDEKGKEVLRMDREGHRDSPWESSRQPHAHRYDKPNVEDHAPIKGEGSKQ